MKNNITLRELYIGGNELKEEGGNFIATGIISNRSITTLDLGILLERHEPNRKWHRLE